jgi:hypothetical protein
MGKQAIDENSNPSCNESIQAVIDRVDPRRRFFLKSSAGAAAIAALGGVGTFTLPIRSATAAPAPTQPITFAGIPANVAPMMDKVSVPAGYKAEILISWGDPILAGAPPFAYDASQTAADQEKQFGTHNDGMHYFPFPGPAGFSSERGILCVNDEYTPEEILHGSEGLTGGAGVTLAKVRKSQAAHGLSFVEVRRTGGKWQPVVGSPFNRRVTANTPMKISGPAAGHSWMKTGGDPTGTTVLGTINNCAHGFTPWGTYLTCEENFNGNFGAPAAVTQTALERRYGLTAAGFGYNWHVPDPRFDIRGASNLTPEQVAAGQVASNEPNRFGYVVEVDPFNPRAMPVKRTALGRFKHEGAWSTVGSNNVVAIYSGDDERNEYIYKFVCSRPFNPANRAANFALLDEGTLYVAKFTDTPVAGKPGTYRGEWLPLTIANPTLAPHFASQGEICVNTRGAADRVGATMMDRPEWGAVHPVTREVYMTLTNNNRRGTTPPSSNAADGSTSAGSARPPVDTANPRPNNVYGHIIRWREDGDDPAATGFEWEIFVECGDTLDTEPTQQGNINDAPNGSADYGAPDGLWFDQYGRLWIQTDQIGDASGDWVNIGGNVMMCADPATGLTKRFLTGPPKCEVTGVDMTPDGKTMFVGIQHPGEDATPADPDRFSAWPDNGLNGPTTLTAVYAGLPPDTPRRPRSSIVVITREDGGVVGGQAADPVAAIRRETAAA